VARGLERAFDEAPDAEPAVLPRPAIGEDVEAVGSGVAQRALQAAPEIEPPIRALRPHEPCEVLWVAPIVPRAAGRVVEVKTIDDDGRPLARAPGAGGAGGGVV